MRRHSQFVLALLIGAAVPALGQGDPRKILEDASAAIKAAGAMRYEGRGELAGNLAVRMPRMTGTVVAMTGPEGKAKLRVEGDVALPNGRQVKMHLANDGTAITMADYAQRVFITRPAAGAEWMMLAAVSLIVPDLGAAEPLKRELSEGKLELAGEERLGEVACDVIRAIFPDGSDATWAIARSDRLPRRVARTVQQPAQGTITTTITKIEPTIQVNAETFTITKPEGFIEPVMPDQGQRPAPIAAGTEAPDFTLKTPEGQDVSLKGLRGKVVLLDFWATWCGPCKMAMPALQKLHEKYKDKPVAIVGVNCRERGQANPAEWFRAQGFTYPLLLNGNEVATKYNVNGIPMFCLIGPDGKVLMSAAGFSPQMEQEIDRQIAAALAQAAPAAAPAGAGS